MIDGFYITDAIICTGFVAAYTFYHHKTKLRHYALLAVAAGLFVLVDILALVDAVSVEAWIALLVLTVIALTIWAFVLTQLLKAWLISMELRIKPSQFKTSLTIAKLLLAIWPAIGFINVILVIVVYVSTVSVLLLLVVAILYLVGMAIMVVTTLWLFSSAYIGGAETTFKKNQMARLLALSILVPIGMFLACANVPAVAAGIVFWVWMAITVWPRALVNYDLTPAEPIDQQMGMIGGGVPVVLVDPTTGMIQGQVMQTGIDAYGNPIFSAPLDTDMPVMYTQSDFKQNDPQYQNMYAAYQDPSFIQDQSYVAPQQPVVVPSRPLPQAPQSSVEQQPRTLPQAPTQAATEQASRPLPAPPQKSSATSSNNLVLQDPPPPSK